MALGALSITGGALRFGWRDAPLLALAFGHAAALALAPSAPLVALALWWNANTVAHNFIHLPFFRSRAANGAFSLFESLVLGFPQTVWRDRHLAHHAGRAPRWNLAPRVAIETGAVLGLWTYLASRHPGFFTRVYLPGYAAGLVLCYLQGRFEHSGGTTSHYGPLYNLLFFNDGYHVEHHAHPAEHWSNLPERRDPAARSSGYPAVLRWLDGGVLEILERIVLRSRPLQRFVVDRHARAFARLAPKLEPVRGVTIVGGGLFPRTALVLARLFPDARLTIVDRSARNLERARALLPSGVEVRHELYDPGGHDASDLVVVPLAYAGDRNALYGRPPAPALLVHDWIWRRRGESRIVSWLLLKRLNLVRR